MGLFDAQFGAGSIIGGGYFGDVLDLSGKQAAEASIYGANKQLESTRAGIAEQKRAREQAREDLAPFRQAGQTALSGLSSLITDPSTQVDYLQDNRFLKSITNDAIRRIQGNQATRGREDQTRAAAENTLKLLGPDLINQSVSQRFNLATLGANAAGQQATTTQGTGNTIADLFTQGANAQAAGVVGAQNAQTNAQNQAATAVGSYYANRG